MNKLNIHFFQHVPYENPGTILEWAEMQGHNISSTRFYESHSLPDIYDFDWLVIMGGPMNVYQESTYPWLAEEKKFIRRAIDSGKKVIGICLGSQLLADALGARVFKNKEKEIGWFDIEFSSAAQSNRLLRGLEQKIKVFHWHGDTFDLPPGSAHLASSEGCRNQGFIYNDNVVAFQFHIETTKELLGDMIENGRADLTGDKFVQAESEITNYHKEIISNKQILFTILDRI